MYKLWGQRRYTNYGDRDGIQTMVTETVYKLWGQPRYTNYGDSHGIQTMGIETVYKLRGQRVPFHDFSAFMVISTDVSV